MAEVEPAIRLRGVHFGYEPQAPVIAIEAFEVGAGEQVFLEGASGSGKSTLLGMIGGILVPSAGEVRVLGRPLSDLGGAARDRLRADHVGFVFQMFNLLPYLSVVDNVLLACRFSPRRSKEALSRSPSLAVEAERLLGRLGLDDEVLDRPVTRLSIGQQQRVAVARALIGAPELVIADEPTSALDADARLRFIELLTEECAAGGSAVLFASHDPALAANFGRSLSMAALNTSLPDGDGA